MKNEIQNAIRSCEERIKLYEDSISKKNYMGRNRLRHSVYLENVKIAALRAQEEAEKNEPLTLDELRQMDGEPVWVRSKIDSIDSRWGIIDKRGAVFPNEAHYVIFSEYGDLWTAYRHKQKEENHETD